MLIHATQAVNRTVLQRKGAGGKFSESIVLSRALQQFTESMVNGVTVLCVDFIISRVSRRHI